MYQVQVHMDMDTDITGTSKGARRTHLNETAGYRRVLRCRVIRRGRVEVMDGMIDGINLDRDGLVAEADLRIWILMFRTTVGASGENLSQIRVRIGVERGRIDVSIEGTLLDGGVGVLGLEMGVEGKVVR
jgi:hypothetical protein